MEVERIGVEELEQYARIPIAFEVRSVLRVVPIENGLGGLRFVEEACSPYRKDYDQYEGAHPSAWSQQFDLTKWDVFVARHEGDIVGGAAVARGGRGFESLEEQQDTAVLWDLRVDPRYRGQRIGSQLVEEIVRWLKAQNYRRLLVETQNVNVPACRFYARQGFVLATVDPFGYEGSPLAHEVKLLWALELWGK